MTDEQRITAILWLYILGLTTFVLVALGGGGHMTDCDECGDRLVDPRDKNLSGWWRDRCLPCIREEHGHALTDEEILGSRPQFRVTIAEADDGQFRAFEEASDSDRSGRDPDEITPETRRAVAEWIAREQRNWPGPRAEVLSYLEQHGPASEHEITEGLTRRSARIVRPTLARLHRTGTVDRQDREDEAALFSL